MKPPTVLEQLANGPIVYYDVLPDVQEIHDLLSRGVIAVEKDRDRVGWSKTGIVYRVTLTKK